MLLFGSKLVSAKKPAEDLPAEEESSTIGSSLISAQKEAINTLSKHEKLLLLELQRTRLNIVHELQELDPQLSSGNWREVQNAIDSYQRKITAVANEETVDGQRASSKFSLGDPPARKSGILPEATAQDMYKSVTSNKRTKLVDTAAQIPISRIRTGVDMLPVLVSVGLNEVDLSVKRQLPIRMPIFKLPDIDPARVLEAVEDAKVPNVLKEKVVHERTTTHSHGKRGKSRFRDANDYTRALLHCLRDLSPLEVAFFLGFNRMSQDEWGQVVEEMEKRVSMRVTCDTADVVDDNTPCVFMRARGAGRSIFEASQSGTGAIPEAAEPGGLFDKSSSVMSASTTKGRAAQSAPRGPTTSFDTTSLFSSHSRAASQSSSKARSTRGVKNKIQESLQRSQSTSELLKEELVASLRSMQHHTVGVKAGIASLQSLVQIDNPRAKQMLFSVAAERMQAALRLVIRGELRRGWWAWRMVNGQLRRRICTAKTIRVLGLRIVAEKLNNAVCRILEKKYLIWANNAQREAARLKRETQVRSTVEIQRHMRAFLARKRVRFLKEQIKYRKLYAAVIKIQAQIRGRLIRWKYIKFMRGRLEEKSVLKIQRRFRGYRGRKRVKIIRFQRNKVRAAICIQALVRGRFGRVRYHTLNIERLKVRAAIKIEALVRGFLTRRSIAKILLKKRQDAAVIVIQALWRGGVCRMSMDRKRREIREYRETRYRAARDVQRIFRGWRSRLSTRIKFIEQERKNRKLGEAATKINNIVRRFLAKATVRDKRKQRMQNLLADARAWKEMWSEDSEAWFYLNGVTGEDLWQPPATGYTKADGTLVLATGAIIEDPLVSEAKEVERKKTAETTCCECEERAAIKYCRQCGDRYCTPCFRTSHATGTRRNHTTDAVGPIDCSECEIVLAIRWCVSCDEAYCDGCWRKVHGRGKRRFHPFCEVSSKGRIDPRQLTMDGTELSTYDPTYSQQMADSEESKQALDTANEQYQQYTAEQTEYASQWETYQDDSGTDYYFNTVTGETTYDYPW